MTSQVPGAEGYGPGITSISVGGFKSLATKTEAEIRPLTVLAGLNSSGKSSLMQPLLLIKQTLESNFTAAGPFLLSGPYLQYTETEQFLTHAGRPGGSNPPLTLEFRFNEGSTAGMAFSSTQDSGLSVVESWGSNSARRTEWKFNKEFTSEELRAMLLSLGTTPLVMDQAGFTKVAVNDSGFYLSIRSSAGGPSRINGLSMSSGEVYSMQEILELNAQVARIIYVPRVRGTQRRRTQLAEVAGRGIFPGSFESYAPSLIFSWLISDSRGRLKELDEALTTLDLTSGVRPFRLNESELETVFPEGPTLTTMIP